MSGKIVRFLVGLIAVILILSLALGAFGAFTVRRSLPQVKGELHLKGLDAAVEVYRDAYAIPHIYATTQHDLFFAQGYVHAQDRFWQMDFWRHIGSGRLAEMFGKSQVDADRFLRSLGWGRLAEQELASMDPGTRAILQAYADGVNAYLADHQGSALSLEYAVLSLLSPSYKIEPWQPLNTLTWAKAMAWDLRGNLDEEIERAILLKTLTPQQVDDISPRYPEDHPYILPDFKLVGSATPVAAPAFLGALAPALKQAGREAAILDGLLGPAGVEIGSNNWTISGKLTASGKPLLANDPHLAAQMPSIWYEVGLHCVQKSAACPFEVTGFSFAGVPGVVIGHNDRVAWGFTNVGPDVQDLFIEKINPNNPNQYEVNGQWQDMEVLTETIKVAGGSDLALTVRKTRHGPLITDTFLPENFGQIAGINLPAPFAAALKWTALEPTELFRAILGFDAAQNWDEFRAAAQYFAVPAQNLVYADVDGNIGYQMPGRIPMRAKGDGRLPVPGWTDEYEWQGYVPFEKLPYAYNPPQGFIATANNAVVGPDYPYLITTDWDLGYRAQRIVELITQAGRPIDAAYIAKIQGDNQDLSAAFMVPLLMQVKLNDSRLEKARQMLQNWDFQMGMESAPAALYAAFWRHVLAGTFDNKLPEDLRPQGSSRWFEVMRRLAPQADSPWWDVPETSQVEKRDNIFRQAFGDAVAELEKSLGKDPARWKWGDLHTLTLRNQSLGESGVAAVESIFNRGPFRTAGGSSIVNATGWDASKGYEVLALPSMRMIVDLGNLPASQSVITTGQSGHAFDRHYADETDLWRTIQFHPMLWEQSQVQAAAVEHLRLLP